MQITECTNPGLKCPEAVPKGFDPGLPLLDRFNDRREQLAIGNAIGNPSYGFDQGIKARIGPGGKGLI